MGIRKKLWNWCPRPKKPVSTYFTKLAIPLYVPILTGMVVLGMFAAVILPPILFSQVEESGRVTEVMERVLFPGGAIVVYKHPIYETPKWYIRIKIHNYITCEEDLSAYVNSRTNALNELLESLSPDEKVWVMVTFKEPLEPADFKNFYENYLAESETLGHSGSIIVENETSGELETIILNAPSPEYLEEFITHPKEGLKMMSVISVEALVKVDVAKSFKQDPRTLLVDTRECLTVRELVRKYALMGFLVTVDSPPTLVRVFEPELTCGTTNIEELLANPHKYDRWRLYVAGKVSDLGLLENSFFILNEKLRVCYKYHGIDLSKQIAAEDIKNEDYVTVVGTFFQDRSILYADKIEKVKRDYSMALTVDELLANAAKYDRQMVQVFGRVSDLGHLEESFFKLDGKIMVCYIYNNINLSSQISEVENGDPMIVTGVFYHDGMILYAESIRPSKKIKQ